MRRAGPLAKTHVLLSDVWGGARESARATSSQWVLTLLLQGTRFEKQETRTLTQTPGVGNGARACFSHALRPFLRFCLWKGTRCPPLAVLLVQWLEARAFLLLSGSRGACSAGKRQTGASVSVDRRPLESTTIILSRRSRSCSAHWWHDVWLPDGGLRLGLKDGRNTGDPWRMRESRALTPTRSTTPKLNS